MQEAHKPHGDCDYSLPQSPADFKEEKTLEKKVAQINNPVYYAAFIYPRGVFGCAADEFGGEA